MKQNSGVALSVNGKTVMRCVTGSDSDSDESDKFFEASSDTNTIQVDETILYSRLIYWKQLTNNTGAHFPMGWLEEMFLHYCVKRDVFGERLLIEVGHLLGSWHHHMYATHVNQQISSDMLFCLQAWRKWQWWIFCRYVSVTCMYTKSGPVSYFPNSIMEYISPWAQRGRAHFKPQKWILNNCHQTLVHWPESELLKTTPIIRQCGKIWRKHLETGAFNCFVYAVPDQNESLKQVVVELSSNVISDLKQTRRRSSDLVRSTNRLWFSFPSIVKSWKFNKVAQFYREGYGGHLLNESLACRGVQGGSAWPVWGRTAHWYVIKVFSSSFNIKACMAC